MVQPTLGSIRKHSGIAGVIAYSVPVTYPDEPTETITFRGSVYGGPVVMVTPGNPAGVFVTDPARFGRLSPVWVRRFFGADD